MALQVLTDPDDTASGTSQLQGFFLQNIEDGMAQRQPGSAGYFKLQNSGVTMARYSPWCNGAECEEMERESVGAAAGRGAEGAELRDSSKHPVSLLSEQIYRHQPATIPMHVNNLSKLGASTTAVGVA